MIVEEEINNKEIKKEESFIPEGGMTLYYQHFFPYELFFNWLGHGDIDNFQRREFSFTLQNDVYFRFQSFSSNEEFKTQLIKLCPKKIDIGAVYNVLPTAHKTSVNFYPQEKEIVFDIDMTDYDDIRTCCQDTKICDKCWKYMIVAYKIIDATLKEDFGFNHMLYAFSGRRGIHCWICDNRARKLKDNGRSAIAHYIKYKMANLKTDISQGLHEPIHPIYERGLKIIDQYFNDILNEQNLLGNVKGKDLLKGLIKSYFYGVVGGGKSLDSFLQKIDNILNGPDKSVIKMSKIEEKLIEAEKKPKKNSRARTDLCIKDFKLNILYPRLDINVSTHINHLLKSPFCIHPKTGLVAVPLQENDILNFKMEDIPRLDKLIEDFKNKRENQRFNYFKIFFEKFVTDLIRYGKEEKK